MTDKFKFGDNTYGVAPYPDRLQTPMQTQDVLAQIDALLEGRQFSSMDEDRPGAILRKTPFYETSEAPEHKAYREEYGGSPLRDEPHVSPMPKAATAITEPRSFVAEMERIWLVEEKAKNDADSRDEEDVV